MPAPGLVRALYTRASDAGALRRPLDAIRRNPYVRAYARRHLQLLLGRGSSWANVDGALRLLAEDGGRRVAFGPWEGEAATELLYWAPFVRWAQEHFAIDPERIVAVSRGGVAHWYEGACGAYFELDDGVGELGGALTFRPDPVLALVERYRNGSAAPRPLLKRARHVPLPVPEDVVAEGLPDRYVAVAGLETAQSVVRMLSSVSVVRIEEATENVPPARRLRAQHALIGRATGLVAAWPGLALLGALSGVPTVAVRTDLGAGPEADLDLAIRVAGEIGAPLTVLDTLGLDGLSEALGGGAAARNPGNSGDGGR